MIVTIALLDISAIREAANEIDIKLALHLSWVESRALYHNLKTKLAMNTLNKDEASRLWVPNLIYRNNKENDDTRSEKSILKISREGSFSRSGVDVVDEIEVFQGSENPVILMQAYTKVFKCEYHLATFPFDTQVAFKVDLVNDNIFRCAMSSWWWTRLTGTASIWCSGRPSWTWARSSLSTS